MSERHAFGGGKIHVLLPSLPKLFYYWGVLTDVFSEGLWSKRFGKLHFSEITMHLVVLKVLRIPTIKYSLIYPAIPKRMTIGTWILGFHLSSISQNTMEHSLVDATLHKDGSPSLHEYNISVNSFLLSFKVHITSQWGDSPTPWTCLHNTRPAQRTVRTAHPQISGCRPHCLRQEDRNKRKCGSLHQLSGNVCVVMLTYSGELS